MSFEYNQLKRLISRLGESDRETKINSILSELKNEKPAKVEPFDKREGLIFVDGKMVDWQDAKIHMLTHTFHYGCGVFEGVRAYMDVKNNAPTIFRLEDHTNRLFASAKIMNMKLNFSKEEINEAQLAVVRQNEFNLKENHSIYIRPMFFYGSEGMGLQASNLKTHIMVAAWEWSKYLPGEIDICISSFTRHHVNSNMTRSKTNGHYINSLMSQSEAVRNGYNEGLLLDSDGYVSEGSGANIFIVKDGIVKTPPLHSCLNGITRDTTFYICKKLGIKVEECKMTRDDIYVADEAFFTGSAAEITTIRTVDGRSLENQNSESIVEKIRLYYKDLISNNIDDCPKNWLSLCK